MSHMENQIPIHSSRTGSLATSNKERNLCRWSLSRVIQHYDKETISRVGSSAKSLRSTAIGSCNWKYVKNNSEIDKLDRHTHTLQSQTSRRSKCHGNLPTHSSNGWWHRKWASISQEVFELDLFPTWQELNTAYDDHVAIDDNPTCPNICLNFYDNTTCRPQTSEQPETRSTDQHPITIDMYLEFHLMSNYINLPAPPSADTVA